MRSEDVVMSLWFAGSALVVFALLFASLVAVLWGPQRGPGFVRRAAWMFGRPRTFVEWFGFGVACVIAFGTQLLPAFLASGDVRDFGGIGRIVLLIEYPLALVWIAYVSFLYLRPGQR